MSSHPAYLLGRALRMVLMMWLGRFAMVATRAEVAVDCVLELALELDLDFRLELGRDLPCGEFLPLLPALLPEPVIQLAHDYL